MAVNMSQAGLTAGTKPSEGEVYLLKIKEFFPVETKTGKLRFVINTIIDDGPSRMTRVTFPPYQFLYWIVGQQVPLDEDGEDALLRGYMELEEVTGIPVDELLKHDVPTEQGEATTLTDAVVGVKFEAVIKFEEWDGGSAWQVEDVIGPVVE